MFSWTSWHLHQSNMGPCLNSHPQTWRCSSSLDLRHCWGHMGSQAMDAHPQREQDRRSWTRALTAACTLQWVESRHGHTNLARALFKPFFPLLKFSWSIKSFYSWAMIHKGTSRPNTTATPWWLWQVYQQGRNLNLHAKTQLLQFQASGQFLILSVYSSMAFTLPAC